MEIIEMKKECERACCYQFECLINKGGVYVHTGSQASHFYSFCEDVDMPKFCPYCGKKIKYEQYGDIEQRMIKVIFDDKNTIVGIQPLKMQK